MMRRTKQQMTQLRDDLAALAWQHRPVSVRQAFYLAVSAGVIAKSEAEYKTVSRVLADARETGALPWGAVVDHTRTVSRPFTVGGLVEALEITRRTYRRSLWQGQPRRVEVWCEKRTLLGPLASVSDEWDVPLYPCSGYASRTFLHDAAEDISLAAEEGVETNVLYLGDHDPSGVDIERVVVAGLRRYAPDASISAVRLAVSETQIRDLSLPTRPTKTSDTRARNFAGESVEVEAIQPELLRRLVSDAIEVRADLAAMEDLRMVEADERETLRSLEYRVRDG